MQGINKPNAANSSGLKAIKDDLGVLHDDAVTLRDDAAALARDVRSEGAHAAREGIDQLYAAGEDKFQHLEARIKAKPGQSVMLAFAAGLCASYLLGGRR